jgi:hypothetical protein
MLNWLLKSSPPRPSFPQGGFVAFVTSVEVPKQVNPDKPYFSNIASTRLRVLIPARQLARRVPVWLVPFEEVARHPDLAQLGRPGAIVLGKLTGEGVIVKRQLLVEMLRRLRDSAHTPMTYADLSDDYVALGKQLGEPFLAEYQKTVGGLCSLIVPCTALSRSLARYAKRGITVIEDPYESPSERPVRVAPSTPMRLAWFGNLGAVNQPWLEQAFGRIASSLADMAIRLEVVASDKVRERVLAMGERLRSRHPGFELSFTAWSLAVASPIPAYQELAQYGWVGTDLGEGLRWAIAHRGDAARRVTEGQRYVETRFAPEAIGRKWAEVLGIPA